MEWGPVAQRLADSSAPAPDAHNARTTWLTTLNADGSRHVTPVGALWLDDAYWFQTGGGTRKSRNLARDPRCTMAVSVLDADVVVEAVPDESGTGITAPFNAPALGPPPWNVHRPQPRSAVVVLGTEPGGLSRFVF